MARQFYNTAEEAALDMARVLHAAGIAQRRVRELEAALTTLYNVARRSPAEDGSAFHHALEVADAALRNGRR
jgi:hypothetical protein